MKTLDEIPPTWSQTLSPASERFELVLNEEAVLDKETGLVWDREGSADTKSWLGADLYCSTLVIGNRMGWRLPTREELTSLIDPLQEEPALSPGYAAFFDNMTASSRYWSSTAYPDSPFAYAAHLYYNIVKTEFKTAGIYVRAVRGGQ